MKKVCTSYPDKTSCSFYHCDRCASSSMDPKNEALKRRDAGEEEPIEGPHDHNYCEITIGSSLGPEVRLDAYRIERKLGWGTCSTIWLALDTRFVYALLNL